MRIGGTHPPETKAKIAAALTGFKRPPRTVASRFWPKVDQSGGPAACWLWTGGRTTGLLNYGILAARLPVRTRLRAHRVSWELHNGPIPDGLWVLHRCDNPPCVNPAHLFLGTLADNNRDMSEKGHNHGPKAVLTVEDVVLIRQRRAGGERVSVLAREFGITASTLYSLLSGHTWKHVT